MNALVFELVGPAGVGKTAVLQAIAHATPALCTGIRIDRLRQLPGMLWSLVVLSPALIDMTFTDAREAWPGLRHLGRLRTLPTEVIAAQASGHQAILLDEGPVFSLGRLRAFHGADGNRGPVARRWQSEMTRWSSLLNGIIFLDAPNTILAERIRQRSKAHQIKSGSTREMFAFLDRYRAAYRDIVQRMNADSHIPIMELDTSTASVEQITAHTVTALESWGVRLGDAARRGA